MENHFIILKLLACFKGQMVINANMLPQEKSVQMGNNLAEQQVNNNNKAKTKQQTQEQLSSPLSQVLKTYDFGNFENCELNTEIILIYHQLPFSFVPCV